MSKATYLNQSNVPTSALQKIFKTMTKQSFSCVHSFNFREFYIFVYIVKFKRNHDKQGNFIRQFGT